MGAAEHHEARVIWASNPALLVLLGLGRVIGPLRWIPGLGWVVRRAFRRVAIPSYAELSIAQVQAVE